MPAQPLTLDAERTTVHVHNVCDVCDGRVFTMLHEWQGRKTCVICVIDERVFIMLRKRQGRKTCTTRVVFDERVFTTLRKWQDRKMYRTRVMSVMAECSQSYAQLKKDAR